MAENMSVVMQRSQQAYLAPFEACFHAVERRPGAGARVQYVVRGRPLGVIACSWRC
jgi:hypothetical protein